MERIIVLVMAFCAAFFKQGDCQKRSEEVVGLRRDLCPKKCRCVLEVLDLAQGIRVNCTGLQLKRFPSPLPSTTTTLVLKGNKISLLRSEHFIGLQHLRTLDLEDNRLKALKADMFGVLPMLRTLNVRSNRIRNVEFGFLRNAPGVRVLILAGNKISRLEYGLFDIADQLQLLDLSKNNISVIQDGSFLGLKRLQTLKLNDNKLTRISTQLFPDAYSLKSLYLDHNRIAEVQPNAFVRQNILRILSLSSNRLPILSYRMLTGLKSLEQIYLQHNKITTIDPWALTQLKSLQTMFIYSNFLTSVEANIFVGLRNLKVLHLGINNIRYIADDAFVDLRLLVTLYLDSNKLTTLSSRVFSGLRQVRDLQLYFNNISFVANNGFSELIKLNRLVWDMPNYFRQSPEYINAVGNSLYCDCNALWLRNWLRRTKRSGITCQSPPALKGIPLIMVNDSNTICERVRVTVSPSNVLTLNGGDVELHCTAKPGASYTWTLNGSALKLDDYHTVNPLGSLRIKGISKRDVGHYVCIAMNAAGASAAGALLSIGVRPTFSVLPESVDLQEPSKPVIFKCSAKGVPKPTITWLKDGLQIRITSGDSSQFHITADGALMYLGERHHITREGHLIILNPRVQDEGDYTCVVENKVGKNSHRVSLYVDMSSKCVYGCNEGGVCQPSQYECACTTGFHKQGKQCTKDQKPTPPLPKKRSGAGSGSGAGSSAGSGAGSGAGSIAGSSAGSGQASGDETDTSGDGSVAGSGIKVSGSGFTSGEGAIEETRPPIDQEESGDDHPTRPSTHKKKQRKSNSHIVDQETSASGSTDENGSNLQSGSGSGSGDTVDGIVEGLRSGKPQIIPTQPVVGFSRSDNPLNRPPTS